MQKVTTYSFEKLIEKSFFNFLDTLTDDKEIKRRKNAYECYLKLGIPGNKSEEYKYTPIDRFISKNFALTGFGEKRNSALDLSSIFYDIKGNHIVIVNGVYQPELSSFTDSATSFKSSPISNNQSAYTDAFHALNDSLVAETLTIEVPANTSFQPVIIYHVYNIESGELFVNNKIDIKVGTGSKLIVLEKTECEVNAPTLVNKQTSIDIEKNASVNITNIQNYSKTHFQVYNLNVNQKRDSIFNSNTYSLSGSLIRNNLNVSQNDEHCESHMYGMFMLNADSHVDNHTSIDHKKPNAYSNELYTGILDESSTGVFNGKIYVRPDAQQTNAFQSNKNISLSDNAKIHTKPQLEIWADDVKCSHGCTVGRLDEEAIFYLRTRGIDRKTAKAMLLVAFSEESFKHIPLDFVKEELHKLIQERLC